MQSPLAATRPSTIKTRHRGAASRHESAGAASRRESAASRRESAASSTPSESGAASSSESGAAKSAPTPGLRRPGQLDRCTSGEFAHLATGAGDDGLSCVEADDNSRSNAARAEPRAASFCGAPCTFCRPPPPRTTLSTRQRASSRPPNMVLRYRALPAVIEPAEREHRVSLRS
ncbi:hypothetical protein M885DRAFT_540469 [Pelagophyceae sp. CCMP2097]|nr:hypothetical protein M885DRAFT_540469 [Pelagophyceae sp. CCMP2097]